MTRTEQKYNKQLAELTAKVGKLSDAEVDRVMALLGNAIAEIDDAVSTTEWQAYRLKQLKDAVEQAITSFSQQYQAGADDALKNIWLAGIDAVDIPLATVGIRMMASELNREALEIMQGYTMDLIKNVSADALKRITGEITMGILGQKSPWEVMQAIGRTLNEQGIMHGIARRAETITRTEMSRVHSAAREGRLQQVVANNPDLPWMKKWISAAEPFPRPKHAALNGKMVPVGENFPGGFPYPHAPGLSAGETINCKCTHVLTLADWEDVSEEKQPFASSTRAIYN